MSIKLQRYTLATSSILFLESHRNLLRLMQSETISEDMYFDLLECIDQDYRNFIVKNVDADVVLSKAYPVAMLPKSLDLIHLRTCLWFGRTFPDCSFLTFDKKQARAAKQMGLKLFDEF